MTVMLVIPYKLNQENLYSTPISDKNKSKILKDAQQCNNAKRKILLSLVSQYS